MRCQFYHAIALCVLIAPGCGRPPSDTPAPKSSVSPSASAATAPASPTPTSEGVRLGKDAIERIRAAAGGAKLTAMRSFYAKGTSTMSVIPGARSLTIRAMFPGFYRQEEIPATTGGLGVAIGVGAGNMGWMLGARISGAGRSGDANAVQAAYNRAGSQAMVGVLAGVSAPWLLDSGQFTAVAGGTVDRGDDRNLVIVNLEGPLGRAGRLLIDPGTNLPRRFIEPPQLGTGGAAGREEINFTYSDFRDVEGVHLPHTIMRRVGSIQTTWLIEKYTLNVKLGPRDFSRRVAATTK
jgi:hypothetical protein